MNSILFLIIWYDKSIINPIQRCDPRSQSHLLSNLPIFPNSVLISKVISRVWDWYSSFQLAKCFTRPIPNRGRGLQSEIILNAHKFVISFFNLRTKMANIKLGSFYPWMNTNIPFYDLFNVGTFWFWNNLTLKQEWINVIGFVKVMEQWMFIGVRV